MIRIMQGNVNAVVYLLLPVGTLGFGSWQLTVKENKK